MTAPAARETGPRRCRVLCYIGSLDAGGAERQMLTALQHLDRDKFQPFLLLAHRQGALLPEVPPDVPVFSATGEGGVVRLGLGRFQRWRRFARLLHEQQIDVVYDRTYLATLDAAIACRWRPTPRVSAAVADPHVQFEIYARRPHQLWKSLSRWAYRSASLVLANSQGLRAQLLEFWQLPAEKVEVQPNGYDFERMTRLSREQIQLESHPSKKPLTVLTVGRIDRDKGHCDLLEAWKILVQDRQHRELRWQIVGTGPDQAALQQQVRASGLSDSIQYLGEVANPFPLYAQADLFCLPSRSEGLPNVLIEALGLGLPVLATDCPSGPREILADGTYGRLVPVQDPVALADAMEHFRTHREDWRQQATEGARSVRERYSAAVTIRQLEERLWRAAEMSMPAP